MKNQMFLIERFLLLIGLQLESVRPDQERNAGVFIKDQTGSPLVAQTDTINRERRENFTLFR